MSERKSFLQANENHQDMLEALEHLTAHPSKSNQSEESSIESLLNYTKAALISLEYLDSVWESKGWSGRVVIGYAVYSPLAEKRAENSKKRAFSDFGLLGGLKSPCRKGIIVGARQPVTDDG